ncbi:MAG: 7-cyano-7-deazaguanine synthase QueC [Elusimicrobia bacterium]|nr:7-cyano-7-deazaguanine synthase QueC [Elusimicrobiota bacterium]
MPKQKTSGDKKAVVLFSGGLDSSTALCWALKKGYECRAVSVFYGQRHKKELKSAEKIARLLGVKLFKINLKLPWLKTSSLVDAGRPVPDLKISGIPQLPSTYVPGRNLLFAAIGVSLADSTGAGAVILGPNAVDYSGYPDCRPEFYKALEKSVSSGTKAGISGKKISILTPIIFMSKKDIIKLAVRLKAPLELTWSCYRGGTYPCGRCDSCKLRAKGFEEAGIPDPALWRK